MYIVQQYYPVSLIKIEIWISSQQDNLALENLDDETNNIPPPELL